MKALVRLWWRFLAFYAECEAFQAFERRDEEAEAMWMRSRERFAQKAAQ